LIFLEEYRTFFLAFSSETLYNEVMSIETLRMILFFYLLASFLLAIFYLRDRHLSFWEYTLWGLFALLFPVLGPFLVILARPGVSPAQFSRSMGGRKKQSERS